MLRQESKNFLMIVLGILLIGVFGLSIAYAILNVTLNIVGTATVSSADWDITIENVSIVTDGAASVVVEPTINGTEIKDFNVMLTKPGDAVYITFYVRNNGSIDGKFVTNSLNTPDYGVYSSYITNNFRIGLTTPEETDLLVGESKMFVYEISWDMNSNSLPGNTIPIEISNLGAQIIYEQK